MYNVESGKIVVLIYLFSQKSVSRKLGTLFL